MDKESHKKRTITQPNALIKAQYRLTLLEKRIIKHAMAHINPIREDNPRTYQLPIAKFAECFNVKKERLYTELKAVVTEHFLSRQYGYLDLNTNEKVRRNWLSEIRYEDTKGTLSITFTRETIKLLTDFKKNFTSYDIRQIGNLRSVYSIRLYEICLQEYQEKKNALYNKNKKGVHFKITLEELRQRFKLENQYKQNRDFKRYVLDKPLAEINEKTNITITYKLEKQGRAWHTIIFHVFEKLTEEEKQEKKGKSLSKKLIEIEATIRELQSNLTNDQLLKDCPNYKQEQTELLKQALAKRDEILAKLNH